MASCERRTKVWRGKTLAFFQLNNFSSAHTYDTTRYGWRGGIRKTERKRSQCYCRTTNMGIYFQYWAPLMLCWWWWWQGERNTRKFHTWHRFRWARKREEEREEWTHLDLKFKDRNINRIHAQLGHDWTFESNSQIRKSLVFCWLFSWAHRPIDLHIIFWEVSSFSLVWFLLHFKPVI